MEYQKSYGPSYRSRPPDRTRCAAHVHGDGWGGHQCQRRAVCDPDEQGNPTTCKQHSEAAKKERDAKSKAAQDADLAKWRVRYAAPKMKAALQQIVDGHNDPRALAKEVLEGMEGRK